jgi:hypothetical protein
MNIRLLIFSIFIWSLLDCGGQVAVYRHSGDFSYHIIYLGTNVAICKVTKIIAFQEVSTGLSVGKAHLGENPELASDTGDRFDENIEPDPQEIGISDDNAWLVVIGRKFDEKKNDYIKVVSAVGLSSGNYGRFWSASDLEELQRKVEGTPDLKSIRMQPAPFFFDRMLVTYLQEKARGSESKNNSKTAAGENSPLSPDIAATRTVWVRNEDGKGVQNVKVIVDYDSERHPPTFLTDADGKTEVKVKAGFTLIRLDAGDGDIRMSFRAPVVEWPFEIVLPTHKIRF